MGEVYPLRHHVKNLIWQLEEGFFKKMWRENVYASCNYSSTISFLVEIWLKYLYIDYA